MGLSRLPQRNLSLRMASSYAAYRLTPATCSPLPVPAISESERAEESRLRDKLDSLKPSKERASWAKMQLSDFLISFKRYLAHVLLARTPLGKARIDVHEVVGGSAADCTDLVLSEYDVLIVLNSADHPLRMDDDGAYYFDALVAGGEPLLADKKLLQRLASKFLSIEEKVYNVYGSGVNDKFVRNPANWPCPCLRFYEPMIDDMAMVQLQLKQSCITFTIIPVLQLADGSYFMLPVRGASYTKMAAELASVYMAKYAHFDRVVRLLKDLFEQGRLAAGLPSCFLMQVLKALVDNPNYGAGWWYNKDLMLSDIVHETCRYIRAVLEQPTPTLASPLTATGNLLADRSININLEPMRQRYRELLTWSPAKLSEYIHGIEDRPAGPVCCTLAQDSAGRQLAAPGPAAAPTPMPRAADLGTCGPAQYIKDDSDRPAGPA